MPAGTRTDVRPSLGYLQRRSWNVDSESWSFVSQPGSETEIPILNTSKENVYATLFDHKKLHINNKLINKQEGPEALNRSPE